MSSQLITEWGSYQTGFEQLLSLAMHTLFIYDEDLSTLRLDQPTRLAALKRLLRCAQPGHIRIALRHSAPFRREQTHLIQYLAPFAHIITIQETAPLLNHQRDSMMLVDGQHALIRFDRDQARSKLLINEAAELRPYLRRFDEIWERPGDIVSATTLGL